MGRVFADASGEHQRVESTERCRERAELAANPVDEQVERLGGPRVGLASSARMSLEIPETPSSPDCS